MLRCVTADVHLKTLTMETELLFFPLCGSRERLEMCVRVGLSCRVSALPAAPEEEGARGAAGGRDPGLREDSHGEEQPPERPGQDGQSFLSSLSLYTRHPDGGI